MMCLLSECSVTVPSEDADSGVMLQACSSCEIVVWYSKSVAAFSLPLRATAARTMEGTFEVC